MRVNYDMSDSDTLLNQNDHCFSNGFNSAKNKMTRLRFLEQVKSKTIPDGQKYKMIYGFDYYQLKHKLITYAPRNEFSCSGLN